MIIYGLKNIAIKIENDQFHLPSINNDAFWVHIYTYTHTHIYLFNLSLIHAKKKKKKKPQNRQLSQF